MSALDLEFPGFPADTIQFYTDIVENNEKVWFEANKPRFQKNVQKPAQAFVEALGERLRLLNPSIQYDTRLNGSGSIMRIYRDVRFSKDKTPYKTNLGIIFWQGAGKKTERPAFYFGFDREGGGIHTGIYHFQKGMMDAYREAVADDTLGAELEETAAQLRAAGYTIGGQHYKRVPRGYDNDHPRAELLKHNGLMASAPPISTDMITSPQLVDHCFAHCEQMAPLLNWIVKAMG